MSTPKLDLLFPLQGNQVPLEHGYLLYAAISKLLETPTDRWLHESDAVGLHRIRGRYIGPGLLALDHARFGLRIPADLIPRFLPLAGKPIQLAQHSLRIGIPQPHALIPAATLYAHLVTTKNGQDESRFDEEIARQLAALDIRGKPIRGPRRTFRIKDKQVIAHTLLVSELTADESIRLQEEGLGGRRKLGCGVFVGWEGK
jgi:CRISPR-associated protein Cas6